MYRFLLNLYGAAQMKKSGTTQFELLERDVAKVMLTFGASAVDLTSRYWEYRFSSDFDEALLSTLESLKALIETLEKHKKHHYGYHLWVCGPRDEINPQEVSYLFDEEEGVWITPALAVLWREFVELSPGDDAIRVKRFKSVKSELKLLKESTLVDADFVSRFTAELTRMANLHNHAVIHVYGSRPVDLRSNLESVSGALYNNDKERGHIELIRDSAVFDALEPFRRILASAPGFMNSDAPFPGRNPPPEPNITLLPDSPVIDCARWLEDRLIRYKSAAIKRGARPFALVENPETFPSASQALLELFFSICARERILVVTFSKEKPTRLWGEDRFFSVEEGPTCSYTAFYSRRLRLSYVSGVGSLAEALARTVMELNECARETLFVASLCAGMVPYDAFVEIMDGRGEDRSFLLRNIKMLYELRLLEGDVYPRLVHVELAALGRRGLSAPIAILHRVAATVYQLFHSGRCAVLPEFLFGLLEKAGLVEEALDVLWHRFSSLTDALNFSSSIITDRIYFAGQKITPEQKESLKLLLFSIKLRREGLKDDKASELEAFLSMEDRPALKQTSKDVYVDFCRLQYCRVANSLGRPDEAFSEIKETLFALQKKGSHHGEALANAEMAYSLFLKGKFRQAMEYCEISDRIATQLNYGYGKLLAGGLSAVVNYGYGNLSGAYFEAQKGAALAESLGNREREFFFTFVIARVEFELGRYAEALARLEALAAKATYYRKTACFPVIMAWRGRSLAYLNRFSEAFDLFSRYFQRESLYYFAEAKYLSGAADEALSLINKTRVLPEEEYYAPSERGLWRDGYFLLEGRLEKPFLRVNLLTHLIEGYRIYLKGKVEDKHGALQELIAFYDFDRAEPDEPFGYLYPYYYADLLGSNEKEKKFMAESRAGRILTVRAGRFDNQKMKEEFLRNSAINKRIIMGFNK